jgi:hypothetical protein
MVSYPNLGFDPCPGDAGGYQGLSEYAGRAAITLSGTVSTLASAGSGQWRGKAADAFRDHVHADVLPLAQRARDSVGRAATALRGFAVTLAALQQEAAALDRQAGTWQDQRYAALAAARLPASATAPYPASVHPVQRAQLEEADTALASVSSRAQDIQARYAAAVQQARSQLDAAGNMALRPPGLFSGLLHDLESGWDEIVAVAGEIVHDKALWDFISGVANIIASVAGVLALFPPLTEIFGPIAFAAALIALTADSVLAMFDHGGWDAVAFDLVAVVSDEAWMKSAGKLTGMYQAAGLEKFMTKAPTWAGLVSKVPLVTKIPVLGDAIEAADHTVDVAPGIFRMIGLQLKEAAGSSEAAAMLDELSKVDKQPGYLAWRLADVFAGELNWVTAGIAITQEPGTVHDWADNFATGKEPWQVPSS